MSCPDCFSGHVHEGDVSGEELQLHGLHVYATGPQFQDAKGIIVIIPDAFGWKFINSRLWADEVAKRGSWRVLLPDFMHGE
jgi:dienelactone hydrolase